jgi:hypothetical protein
VVYSSIVWYRLESFSILPTILELSVHYRLESIAYCSSVLCIVSQFLSSRSAAYRPFSVVSSEFSEVPSL